MNEEILNEYKVFLASRHRKERTRTGYYHPVKQFLIWLNKPTDQLTKEDLLKWKADQNLRGYKHNGITIRVIAINMFLKWLKKSKLKLSLPRWKPVNRKTINLEEIKKLIDAAQNEKERLIIRFITDLNCRPSEIINAKLSNIIGDKIYFDDTKTGDNYGFITPSFREALERYRQVRKPQKGCEDYILLKTNGMKYSRPRIVNVTISELALKAQIPPIKPYDLRASVGTEEFNHYINPKVIQRKFRHKLQETTQKYNHVSDGMVRDYVNYALIFDKPCLYAKDRKKLDTKFYLDAPVLTQGLNINLESDNSKFSFSFSLFEQLMGVGNAAI